jgi:RNA polymerase sigma factor (sigma-70 family)
MDIIQHTEADEPYLAMVYGLAGEFNGRPNARISLEDYVNVGLAALEKARQTYDEKRDGKFSTHAHNIIYNEMVDEWAQAQNELSCSQYHIRNTEGAKEETAFQNATIVSLSRTLKEEDRQRLADSLPTSSGMAKNFAGSLPSGFREPSETVEEAELVDKVDEILKTLPADDRDVVHRKIFEGQTFEEIAEARKETWRQVNYRYHQVLEDLKDRFIEAGLDIYA